MIKNWKQFAELATGLRHNMFRATQLRLTLVYVGIVMVLLVIFSMILYATLARNLRENLEGEFGDEHIQERVIVHTASDLRTNIFLADIGALFFVGAASYVLARKTLKPIEKALQLQKQFSGDASHELRTPLAIMKAECEVLERNPDSTLKEYQALVKSNLEEIAHMSALTERLLLLSRSESMGDGMPMARVDVSDVAEKTVARMQQLASQKTISLNFSGQKETFMIGDRNALAEMLLNLIKNAIDFTPHGGLVQVSIARASGRIELHVKDSGIGIGPDDLLRIFDRFYKVDTVRAHRVSGAGLGLSIVQEIVKRHGGTIEARSVAGEGTEMIVTFPASE